jgi:hypothetical protein
VDTPGESFFMVGIGDPVEEIERGSEQDRGQQPLSNPSPSCRSNSFVAAAITAAALSLTLAGGPGGQRGGAVLRPFGIAGF